MTMYHKFSREKGLVNRALGEPERPHKWAAPCGREGRVTAHRLTLIPSQPLSGCPRGATRLSEPGAKADPGALPAQPSESRKRLGLVRVSREPGPRQKGPPTRGVGVGASVGLHGSQASRGSESLLGAARDVPCLGCGRGEPRGRREEAGGGLQGPGRGWHPEPPTCHRVLLILLSPHCPGCPISPALLSPEAALQRLGPHSCAPCCPHSSPSGSLPLPGQALVCSPFKWQQTGVPVPSPQSHHPSLLPRGSRGSWAWLQDQFPFLLWRSAHIPVSPLPVWLPGSPSSPGITPISRLLCTVRSALLPQPLQNPTPRLHLGTPPPRAAS